MNITSEISALLQQGRAPKVKELVLQAIEEGLSPKEILEEGLLAGMSIVGEKFKNNEVFVPEVLIAARAMNTGTEVLKPYLAEAGVENKGTAVIGTVKGDLHDIGKNLVKMMLEGKGIKVIDLGVDVAADTFVQQAIENDAQVICCLAFLMQPLPQTPHLSFAPHHNKTDLLIYKFRPHKKRCVHIIDSKNGRRIFHSTSAEIITENHSYE